jgi:hypothetical protein
MVRLGTTEIVLCVACLCFLVILVGAAVGGVIWYQRKSKAKKITYNS